MGDVIVWADIPATDLQRAMRFYGHVTGQPVTVMPGSDDKVALIGGGGDPQDPIVSADIYAGGTPSIDGATVYLASDGDIDGMLARVVEAGGEILQDKQFMGDMVGTIAFIKDSEGNRIGIQQPGQA